MCFRKIPSCCGLDDLEEVRVYSKEARDYRSGKKDGWGETTEGSQGGLQGMREREEEGNLAWRPGGAVTEIRQERGEAEVSKNENTVQVYILHAPIAGRPV